MRYVSLATIFVNNHVQKSVAKIRIIIDMVSRFFTSIDNFTLLYKRKTLMACILKSQKYNNNQPMNLEKHSLLIITD